MSTSTALLSFHNPAGLYDPALNGYPHLTFVQGPARRLLLSGQGGEHRSVDLPEDFEDQLTQCLANVQTALVVGHRKARLAQLCQALEALWGEAPTPARTLIPVPRRALGVMLIEIEATVVLAAPKEESG